MRWLTFALSVILLGSLLGPASARADDASATDRRVAALARELRCPVCQNLSVEDSPSRVAAKFRARIRELVVAGRSDDQIREYFVARYGQWILLSPPRQGIGLALWATPLVLLVAGLAVVLLVVRRWSARSRALAAYVAQDPAALDRARRRLDELEHEAAQR